MLRLANRLYQVKEEIVIAILNANEYTYFRMPTRSKRSSSGISNWPQSERPRERLLSRGSHTLTDAELIAILLRVGVRGKNAIELARDLLERFGSLQDMMSAPLSAWDGIKGLGDAKLAQIIAALELGRRVALPISQHKIFLKSTKQVAEYFSARLRGLDHEHFRVAFLNRQGRLLDDALIAEGTVDIVRPPIRSIIARALQTNASALVIAHNHPSGTAEPSEADKFLTRDIISACYPLGIKILEHIIVTDNHLYSFADMGLLDDLILETVSLYQTLDSEGKHE